MWTFLVFFPLFSFIALAEIFFFLPPALFRRFCQFNKEGVVCINGEPDDTGLPVKCQAFRKFIEKNDLFLDYCAFFGITLAIR